MEEIRNELETMDNENIDENPAEEIQKSKSKTVAGIAAAAVVTGGIGYLGYRFYKNHISKTGKIQYQQKQVAKKAAKLEAAQKKLEQFNNALLPQNNVVDTTTPN